MDASKRVAPVPPLDEVLRSLSAHVDAAVRLAEQGLAAVACRQEVSLERFSCAASARSSVCKRVEFWLPLPRVPCSPRRGAWRAGQNL